jgi:hypothetical protein
MKKLLLPLFGAMLCLLPLTSTSQTYSAWGLAVNETNHMYDTLSASGDSLTFVFPNTQATAWGTPKLIVYYEGNFGDWYDYMELYDETLNYSGTTNQSSYNYDCSPEDSTVFQLSPTDINTWTSNNSIVFTLIPSSGPGSCNISRVRVRLVYNYCLSGLPSQYATPSISSPFVCSTDAPYALTGTPAGGVFSGTGVSGSSFNPANLSPGNYIINYTATDSQSCTTTGAISVVVRPKPIVNNNDTIYACIGTTVNLNANIGSSFVWYSDAALSNSIATTNNFATPPLMQTTSYWVAGLDNNNSLAVTSVTNSNFGIIDQDNLAGDDRGGIAVTPNYVYLNGDDNAVRFDLNLTPSSGVALPIRDGMFSDLRSGKLWSLWNNTLNAAPSNWPNTFNVDALRGLDSNLNFTNEYVYLSQGIDMGTNNQQSGIFAGAGILGLYSGNTQHWYVIDMDNGSVSDVGLLNTPEFYGSENWCDWGVIESNCSNGTYSVIYRDWNDDDIHRRILPNGAVTTVGAFNGLSDMASLTFNPWNNRWYWHYEGSSSSFGGNNETLGYADATGTSSLCSGSSVGCPTKVTINVPSPVSLTIPQNNICLEDGVVSLSGGSPVGGLYSGIGVGTNSTGTVFYPALSGSGVFTVNYSYTDNMSGCLDVAAATVTVDLCTGIQKQNLTSGISIFPNPTSGNFYFTTNSDVSSLLIEITDTQARVLYSSLETDIVSGSTKQVNVNNLPDGVYFVKMTSGSSQTMKRIIIVK